MKGTAEKNYAPQELNYSCMCGKILAYYKNGSLDILYYKPETVKQGEPEKNTLMLLATYTPANGNSRAELSIKASPEIITAARGDLEKMMGAETIDPKFQNDLKMIHSSIFSAANGLVKR